DCDLGRYFAFLVSICGTLGIVDLDIKCNICGARRLYREERLGR
ncbi:MAG: DNA-directed RNA polymerase subunit RPC12/RpoP, partial [Yoonia sp.]